MAEFHPIESKVCTMKNDEIEVLEVLEKKKTFCPNGVVNPRDHFYVDPSKWNEKYLNRLTVGEYLLLVAPSKSGRTTRALKLVDQLESKFLPIYINMQSVIAMVDTSETFWRLFIESFACEVHKLTKSTLPTLEAEAQSLDTLFSAEFMKLYYGGKRCMLILDDFDALDALRGGKSHGEESKEEKHRREGMNWTRQRFLLTFRRFNQESNCVLVSVLGITNWLGQYMETDIGSGYIRNIIDAPYYFTKEDVYDLFGQYQKQERIQMGDEIIDHIFEQTEGAQGLTVMFGRCFENLRQDYQHTPTFTEWKNFFYGLQLDNHAKQDENYAKMIQLLKESKEAERCKVTLLSFLMRRDLDWMNHWNEMELLKRYNIIKLMNGELSIASPFVKRFVLDSLRSEVVKPLETLPFKQLH